ncbi:hypothetical protein A3736_14125 [Erythrobacter sp. HI0063]|nr:hypothetical protein A3736_14125 [Erythrobacter sp. HI0063]
MSECEPGIFPLAPTKDYTMDQKNQKPAQNQQGDKGKSDHDAQQRQQNEGGASQKGDDKSSETPRQPK